MRLDRYFAGPEVQSATQDGVSPSGWIAMNVGPFGMVAAGHWAEIYRAAYLQSVEVMRPTRYDRAMAAASN